MVAVTAWGLGNVIIASVPLNGLAIAFHRLWTGSLLYVAVLYLSGRRLRREAFRHGWKGGVAFGANIASFFVAVRLTTVASAVTISALQPVVIIGFAAVMFGERIRFRHVASTVVAVSGVALVAFGAAEAGGGNVIGDLVAVLALFSWAAYFIASKQARRHLDTLEYMAVLNVVAFVVVAPVALLTGALSGTEGHLTPAIYLSILAIVLLPGSGHIVMNWAHAHVTLVLASLITLAMPVISTAAAALFLDQTVSTVQVVGIAVVLVALAVVIIGDARQGGEAVEATEPAP
jgi:drug/metabolite transporter (DMT)-like permease